MAIALTIIYYIFLLLYIYLVGACVCSVLLDDRSPIRQIAWIVALIFLPFVGLMFFFFFGRNYRKNRTFSTHEPIAYLDKLSIDFNKEDEKIKTSHIPYYLHQSIRLMLQSSRAKVYENSNFSVLTSGRESFEQLFEDIEKAKEHIHIEFFIIEDDRIGNELRRLLIRKAQERVKVRVIYDYFGSYRLSESYIHSLKKEGVQIFPLLPFGFRLGFSKINYRNHRKIVIIDGMVAYTGGLNVADRYVVGNRLGSWRDTLIRVEGEAVHGLQRIFLSDWHFVDKKFEESPSYYPQAKVFSKNYTQIVHSGPDTEWESILQGLLTLFGNAKKHIYIHTPYFLPPDSLLIAMQMAGLSGIDVRLMLPKRSDTKLASVASSSFFIKLMEAGIKIYYYKDNFLHSKAITIDDEVGIVGTANIDPRSFEQNYELSAFIYDKSTSIALREAFEKDMEQCEEIDIERWKARRLYIRLLEALARLASPLL